MLPVNPDISVRALNFARWQTLIDDSIKIENIQILEKFNFLNKSMVIMKLSKTKRKIYFSQTYSFYGFSVNQVSHFDKKGPQDFCLPRPTGWCWTRVPVGEVPLWESATLGQCHFGKVPLWASATWGKFQLGDSNLSNFVGTIFNNLFLSNECNKWKFLLIN